MNKYTLIVLLFFYFISNSQNRSKYSNEFLNIGVDARSIGMANAVVSSVKDVNSTYWNPAGLLNIDRDEVRKKLVEKNIYCPVYWPLNKYYNLPIGEFAQNVINNSLGLIIDQRYNKKDLFKLTDFFERLR